MLLSLKTKILIAVVGLVFFLSLFFVYIFPIHQQRQLQKSFVEATESLAVTVALGVQIAMESDDFVAIQKAIDFAREDPELIFVTVVSNNNEIWASYPKDFQIDEALQQRKDVVMGSAQSLRHRLTVTSL